MITSIVSRVYHNTQIIYTSQALLTTITVNDSIIKLPLARVKRVLDNNVCARFPTSRRWIIQSKDT